MERLRDFLQSAWDFMTLTWNWSMQLPDAGCAVFIIIALLLALTLRGKMAKACVCIPALVIFCQHFLPSALKM
jgi:hypothetical protein